MAMVSISPHTPSLPDPFTLASGDGTLCLNTPTRTLDVDNGQHKKVLSVTDDPQFNTVTVRQFDPTTGAQKGVDVFAARDGQPFHRISGSLPTKETLAAVGPLGGPALPISHESLNVDGYKIDIEDNREPDRVLGLFAVSPPKDHLNVSVGSDKSGTVSMSSVAGARTQSTSYSPARHGFDLLHPSTWLAWL
jgi:hypothetical protein